MAYTILNSRGDTLTIVREQSVDITTTDIAIHGRGKFEYGKALNQNQVFHLENFANYTPPARPMQGQLWLELSSSPPIGTLRYYDPNNLSPDVPQSPDPLAGWVELISRSNFFSLSGDVFLRRDGDTMFSDTVAGSIGKTEGVLIFETGGGTNPSFMPGSSLSPYLPGGTQFMFIGEGQGNIDIAPDIRFVGNAGSIAAENALTLIYDGDNTGVHGLSIGQGTYTNPNLTPITNLVAEFATDKSFNLYNGSSTPYMSFGVGGLGFISAPDTLYLTADSDGSTGGDIVFHKGTASNPNTTGVQMARFNNSGSFEMLGDGTPGSVGRENGVLKFFGTTSNYLFLGEGQGDITLGPDIRATSSLLMTADDSVSIGIDGSNNSTGDFSVSKGAHVSGGSTPLFTVSNDGEVFENIDATSYASLITADATGKILINKLSLDNAIAGIPLGLPIGAVVIWPSNTAIPTGFQICAGGAAATAALIAVVGSNVPDFRNVFLRGSTSFSNSTQIARILQHRHTVGNQGTVSLLADFPQTFTYAQPSTLQTGFVTSAVVSSNDNLPRHKIVRYIIKHT